MPITEIEIVDDVCLHKQMAIHVLVVHNDIIKHGYFASPEGLKEFGDWLPGSQIRIHYARDFIILSEITNENIIAAVRQIEKEGKIDLCFTS